jgi:CubicO group peptidase (beta-lactamase class C family)
MTHYAGLPAGIPTRGWSDYQGALDTVVALKPLAPAGTRFNYSDVDFIVLGEIVRRVSGQPLDAYAAKNIFQPLGMRDTTFLPPASLKDRIAPADLQGSELRWGDVHDPLAYRMGGVAGQAGVFTTADDLTKFAQMMLAGGKNVLKPASVQAMTTPQSPPGGAALRGLGWDIDSPYAVWFAPSFSTRSYGHTGYTGTAIWIDPETKTFLIVLTNRLHPDGKGNILPMLRRIADGRVRVPERAPVRREDRRDCRVERRLCRIAGVGLIRACVDRGDGTSNLILQGLERVRFTGFEQETPFPIATIDPLESMGTRQIQKPSGVGLYVLASISTGFIVCALWVIESFEPQTRHFDLKIKAAALASSAALESRR